MLKLKEIHTKYKNKFLMKRNIGIFCLEKWWTSPHKRFSNQLNGLLSGMAQQILTLSKELAQMTWKPSNSFPIPRSVLNLFQDVSINHGFHGLELPYMTGMPLALCICTLKSLLEDFRCLLTLRCKEQLLRRGHPKLKSFPHYLYHLV